MVFRTIEENADVGFGVFSASLFGKADNSGHREDHPRDI